MGKEILLVEDDDSLNRAVSLKLSKEGYVVYRAANVKEADELYHMHRVQLIICDIDLPDGSGLDFCRKVRAGSDILFLTALDTEEAVLKRVLVSSGHPAAIFEEGARVAMSCMDREKAKQYRKDVKRGTLDYDKMVQEGGVVFTSDYFFDELGFAMGDVVELTVYDGDRQIPLTVKIMATIDTGDGTYFALPEDIYEELGMQYDSTSDIYITVNPKAYDNVKASLQSIADSGKYFLLYTMDEEMKIGEWGVALVKYPMYGILVMIAVISFMNLINTLITSVITRKRELGVLQAVGLSDRQLAGMLAGEGMVFTFGTLLASVTVGNFLGYLLYRWAKESQFMSISTYHYPLVETVLLSFMLIAGQLGITYFISRRIHKESLIERIRNNEYFFCI